MVNYKQAEFLFVVKHVSAVPPPDIEQVSVSIFAAADQRAASAAEPRVSGDVVTYSLESVIKNKKILLTQIQVVILVDD